MWKILIADDEPKIRRGLRNAIDWEQLGMVVAGEAEDGELALEAVKKEHFDVVLVDICMPFINGLEFIEKLYEVRPNAMVIVITGHDEFTYAQQAIKLHVFDYILKPVSQKQLYHVLTKVKTELEESHEVNAYMNWADEQLKKNLPILRERFYHEWIDGRLTRMEIEEQIRFLDLDLAGQLGVVLVKVPEYLGVGVDAEERERQVLFVAVQSLIKQQLDEHSRNVVFRDNNDYIVGICAFNVQANWRQIDEQINLAMDKYIRQSVIVRYQMVKGCFEEVAETYQELLKEIHTESLLTPIVQSAKLFIDQHYSMDDLNLDAVSQAMKMSPSYLSRLLKNELGFSFVEYLTNVRIKKATQLLNDPVIKIYEVAEKVGYRNQHYFSTAFKKVLGVSPVDYRKGE